MKYYWSETRKIITRFRISDHQLSIETEMPKIPRDQSKCKHVTV